MDEYGTQQPIALLKLLLEKGFLYDRGKEMNCKLLRDLDFIAAMGKAGGGRNEVDPRFISLFSVFNIPFPSEQSLNLIYASILKGHTAVISLFLKDCSTGLSSSVISSFSHLEPHANFFLPLLFLRRWVYIVLINSWVICKLSSQQIIYKTAFHRLKPVNHLVMVPITKYTKVSKLFPEWQWKFNIMQ